MTKDWPLRIEEAQKQTFYTIHGRQLPRIRYGEEDPRWGQTPCRDCGVVKGQFHVLGCEYEMCPSCRKSMAEGCACGIAELTEAELAAPVRRTESRSYRFFVYGFFAVVVLLLLRSLLMLFGI